MYGIPHLDMLVWATMSAIELLNKSTNTSPLKALKGKHYIGFEVWV
jgi:hypothetical protein